MPPRVGAVARLGLVLGLVCGLLLEARAQVQSDIDVNFADILTNANWLTRANSDLINFSQNWNNCGSYCIFQSSYVGFFSGSAEGYMRFEIPSGYDTIEVKFRTYDDNTQVLGQDVNMYVLSDSTMTSGFSDETPVATSAGRASSSDAVAVFQNVTLTKPQFQAGQYVYIVEDGGVIDPKIRIQFKNTLPATAAAPAGALQTETFVYSGSAQPWTVPAGVTEVTAYVWGASGGGSMCNSESVADCGTPANTYSGNGGFVHAKISVTAGSVLKIFVGEGGKKGIVSSVSGNAFKNGGDGHSGDSNWGLGGGGGLTIITTIDVGDDLSGIQDAYIYIISGAGGGGGTYNGNYAHNDKHGGAGGTSTARTGGQCGGVGGGASGRNTAASQYTGEDSTSYSAGGGAGYYGGAKGTEGQICPGGGGSSYTNPTFVTEIENLQSANGNVAVPGATNSHYSGTVGKGVASSEVSASINAGNPGYVVLEYTAASTTSAACPTTASATVTATTTASAWDPDMKAHALTSGQTLVFAPAAPPTLDVARGFTAVVLARPDAAGQTGDLVTLADAASAGASTIAKLGADAGAVAVECPDSAGTPIAATGAALHDPYATKEWDFKDVTSHTELTNIAEGDLYFSTTMDKDEEVDEITGFTDMGITSIYGFFISGTEEGTFTFTVPPSYSHAFVFTGSCDSEPGDDVYVQHSADSGSSWTTKLTIGPMKTGTVCFPVAVDDQIKIYEGEGDVCGATRVVLTTMPLPACTLEASRAWPPADTSLLGLGVYALVVSDDPANAKVYAPDASGNFLHAGAGVGGCGGFAGVGVVADMGMNLARCGKATGGCDITTSSEPGSDEVYPITNMVDGITNNLWFTGVDNPPWFRIDFGTIKTVLTVKIYNRLGTAEDRISNFELWIGNSNNQWDAHGNNKCFTGGTYDNTHATIDASCKGVGQYLFLVGYHSSQILNLAEIEVYGPTAASTPGALAAGYSLTLGSSSSPGFSGLLGEAFVAPRALSRAELGLAIHGLAAYAGVAPTGEFDRFYTFDGDLASYHDRAARRRAAAEAEAQAVVGGGQAAVAHAPMTLDFTGSITTVQMTALQNTGKISYSIAVQTPLPDGLQFYNSRGAADVDAYIEATLPDYNGILIVEYGMGSGCTVSFGGTIAELRNSDDSVDKSDHVDCASNNDYIAPFYKTWRTVFSAGQKVRITESRDSDRTEGSNGYGFLRSIVAVPENSATLGFAQAQSYTPAPARRLYALEVAAAQTLVAPVDSTFAWTGEWTVAAWLKAQAGASGAVLTLSDGGAASVDAVQMNVDMNVNYARECSGLPNVPDTGSGEMYEDIPSQDPACPATMISQRAANVLAGAYRAVDGNTDTDAVSSNANNKCAFTDDGGASDVWLQIDFEQPRDIMAVKIYSYHNVAPRYSGFKIFISDSNSNSPAQSDLCYEDTKITAQTATPYIDLLFCTTVKTGRYLTITVPPKADSQLHMCGSACNYLTLCELEAYGPVSGPASVLTAGAWTHVTLTYPGSGTTASLHVHGAAPSATVDVSTLTTAGSVRITGAAVDDLRVYQHDHSANVQDAGAPAGAYQCSSTVIQNLARSCTVDVAAIADEIVASTAPRCSVYTDHYMSYNDNLNDGEIVRNTASAYTWTDTQGNYARIDLEQESCVTDVVLNLRVDGTASQALSDRIAGFQIFVGNDIDVTLDEDGGLQQNSLCYQHDGSSFGSVTAHASSNLAADNPRRTFTCTQEVHGRYVFITKGPYTTAGNYGNVEEIEVKGTRLVMCDTTDPDAASCAALLPAIPGDTGGWRLVRHIPASGAWFSGDDNLVGDSIQGTGETYAVAQAGGDIEWTKLFGTFDQMVISTGDKVNWLAWNFENSLTGCTAELQPCTLSTFASSGITVLYYARINDDHASQAATDPHMYIDSDTSKGVYLENGSLNPRAYASAINVFVRDSTAAGGGG